MRIIKNYLYNAGYQLLVILLPLITMPYVTRVLTDVGYGQYSYTFANIQYFVLIAGLGTVLYGNREIAYASKSKSKEIISKKFWEIELLNVFSVFATFIVFSILNLFFFKHSNLMWIQSLNIINVLFDISWLFMGLENFKITVFRNTIIKLLSVVLIFAFVKSKGDLSLYIFIMSGTLLLGNLSLWPQLRHVVIKPRISELRPLRHLKPSLSLLLPQIALQFYMQINKSIVGLIDSPTDSGYYYSSDMIVRAILAIVTATGTVMLPHVAKAYAEKKKRKVREMLYKSFDFISFLAVPLSFGLAAISLKAVPWFLGHQYVTVGKVIMIESLVIVLDGWGNALGEQFLLPQGRNKDYTFSIFTGAVVNLILVVPMIYVLGVYGAMFSYCIAEVSVFAYQLAVVRNDLRFRNLFINFPKYLVSGLIMFIIVFSLNHFLKLNVFSLLFEIAIGMFVYAIMIFALKPTILKEGKIFLRTVNK